MRSAPSPLLPNCVDIWYATPDEHGKVKDFDRLAGMLSAAERERGDRFRRDSVRNQFIVTRALARMALASYVDAEAEELDFCSSVHGKPSLVQPAGTDLAFNLSHTQGLIVCGICRKGPIGIDVEHAQRPTNAYELAQRFFSQPEFAQLRDSPQDRQHDVFFRFWTLKEAYVKAQGTGLTTSLSSFAFSLREEGPPEFSYLNDARRSTSGYRFAEFQVNDHHRLALALLDASPLPLTIRLRSLSGTISEELPLQARHQASLSLIS